MGKFEIEIDDIAIDTRFLDWARLKPLAKELLNDITAEHRVLYSQGKKPDGTEQEKYKESYAKAKREGKVGPPGRPGGGSDIPNLRITGDFLGSIQILEKRNYVEARFMGQHYSGLSTGALAGELDKKFGLHYFSKDQEKYIRKTFDKEITKAFKKSVKVTKKI